MGLKIEKKKSFKENICDCKVNIKCPIFCYLIHLLYLLRKGYLLHRKGLKSRGHRTYIRFLGLEFTIQGGSVFQHKHPR